MTGWKTLLIVATVAASTSFSAQAASEGAAETETVPRTESAKAPLCRKAMVNPVTGHTYCLEPRGAPTEMLAKPCRKRDHDDDAFTVYERYSPCD